MKTGGWMDGSIDRWTELRPILITHFQPAVRIVLRTLLGRHAHAPECMMSPPPKPRSLVQLRGSGGGRSPRCTTPPRPTRCSADGGRPPRPPTASPPRQIRFEIAQVLLTFCLARLLCTNSPPYPPGCSRSAVQQTENDLMQDKACHSQYR